MRAKIFSILFSALLTVCLLTAGNASAFSQGGGGMTAPAGKVVETMDSGGYTYVLLEKDGNKTWAACPRMQIDVGQEIALQPGMVMQNFTSKTLNRTFDNIVFSGGPAQ